MIAYVKGKITYKSPTYILIEAGGIGYQIHISLTTYTKISALEEVQLHTYYQIKEDGHSLYGFFDAQEKHIFVHLISVSGIGANTARLLLSAMTADEVRKAIIGENEAAFNKVKGIGPKTAKRLIIELKDKLVKDGGDGDAINPLNLGEESAKNEKNMLREEALTALLALGFIKANITKALNTVFQMHPEATTVEKVIKLALKFLS